MSVPVIDNIQVVYPAGKTSIAPGETAQIVVTAHDADAQTVQVAVSVTDAIGNRGTGQVPITISDPLTYAATAPSGTITGGGTSNTLSFKA